MTEANTPEDTGAQLEATGEETITLEFAGISFVLPASLGDADGDVLKHLELGRMANAVEALVDDAATWRRFRATKPKGKHYRELLDLYLARIGHGSAGE